MKSRNNFFIADVLSMFNFPSSFKCSFLLPVWVNKSFTIYCIVLCPLNFVTSFLHPLYYLLTIRL